MHAMAADLLSGMEETEVNEFIEDLIGRRAPIVQVLRILSLCSQCKHGIKPKTLDHFKSEIIQVRSAGSGKAPGSDVCLPVMSVRHMDTSIW